MINTGNNTDHADTLKAGFVAVIGRPSSGKSTFLNQVCGAKVSIVSSVPQTTRNKIRGIVNKKQGQLVFVDTPGYHLSEKKLNRRLTRLVLSSFEDVDIILFLIDLTRPSGEEDRAIMERLTKFRGPVLVALNKTDLQSEIPSPTRELLEAPGYPLHLISALTGSGFEGLLEQLFELAPEGSPFYPDEFYTDQEPEFRIAEIIREKAIHQTRQEVPHSLYVDISESEFHGEKLWVRAVLYVERESQKGILVGKAGSRIKQIRCEAEEEQAELFPYRIQLDLRVKVHKKWRKQDSLLRRIIT